MLKFASFCLLIFIISTQSKKYIVKLDTSDDQDVRPNKAMDYGNIPVTLGKVCLIHSQCEHGEVCTTKGKCAKVPCKKKADCKAEVSLPTKCISAIRGLPKICTPDHCTSNKDCLGMGPNYRCQPNTYQCKPSYGTCDDNCDCALKYNLEKKESTCTLTIGGSQSKVCMCRKENVAECSRSKPIIENVTPPPIEGGDTQTTTEGPDECPEGSSIVTGNKGDECSGHAGCFQDLKLECAIEQGKTVGQCKKLTCETDADCPDQTILPTECVCKHCMRKYCNGHDDCPEGFGCDGSRLCKRDHGTCEYECDCTHCHDVDCHNGVCFCQDDNDKCSISDRGPSNRRKRSYCRRRPTTPKPYGYGK